MTGTLDQALTPDHFDDASVAAGLLGEDLAQIRQEIARDAASTMKLWGPALTREEFTPSAANLAHYLALRKTDLRPLQDRLSKLGLSSLGRCEAHVSASLEAVLASLGRIAGKPGVAYPSATVFAEARKRLEERQAGLFGPDPGGPRTRIMVTLPSDAADDPALVLKLFAKGADVGRINCAHDDAAAWDRMITNIRKAAQELKREIRVLMDLGGPKIRIREVSSDKKIRLGIGDRFILTDKLSEKSDMLQATVSHGVVLDHLKPGTEVWINDGKIGAKVIEKRGHAATLELFSARPKGERLKTEKGVNVPGAELPISPLTKHDLIDLEFVAKRADIIGYSFVQRPEDIRLLQSELRKRIDDRPLPGLMLKIETPLAVRNLPRLIVQAGGVQPVAVMIARGDLAVEIGLERLSEMQEQILWLCEAAHVPVVWATQVLDNLVKEGSASRAEMTDAAMGQRAECVMLNKGPHLAEAVAFLDGVLHRMDRHQHKKSARLGPLKSWQDPQSLNGL
jgi:pyruvate kinase